MRSATYYQPMARGIPATRGAEWAPTLWWAADTPPRLGARTSGEPLLVLANHGRWVVSCPDCGGAQLACRTDPRFLCVDCGNVGNGGDYRPTVWPERVEEIEAVLEARPPHLRNTAPGERLEDLQVENTVLAAAATGGKVVKRR